MLFEVDTEKTNLNWAVKGNGRIVQNVYNLITTFKYEVAYDRTLGINDAFKDKPLQIAISMATAEIFEIVATREPRATVKSVDYITIDTEGNMQFKVVIDV